MAHLNLMKLFAWLKKQSALRKVPKYFGQVRFVERVSDVPDEISKDVYIVRRGSKYIWVVFMCPCEKNHRLTVNLSPARKPFWRAKISHGDFSLSPSIWLAEDCHSHYWIDNHRIYWVKN